MGAPPGLSPVSSTSPGRSRHLPRSSLIRASWLGSHHSLACRGGQTMGSLCTPLCLAARGLEFTGPSLGSCVRGSGPADLGHQVKAPATGLLLQLMFPRLVLSLTHSSTPGMFIEFRYLLGMQKLTLGIWEHVAWWETQQRNHGGRGRLFERWTSRHRPGGRGWAARRRSSLGEHAVIGEQGCRMEPGCCRDRGDWERWVCALLGNLGFIQGVWEALEKL